MRKTAFAVGRCDRKSRRLLVLKYIRGPIVGPWSLRAVVARNFPTVADSRKSLIP